MKHTHVRRPPPLGDLLARAIVVLTLVTAVTASPAYAQSRQRSAGLHGLGPRVGLSIDPDQIHVGGHLDLGDVATRLMLRPTLEAGFGEHLTVIAITAELNYRFPRVGGGWSPYVGGGMGPVFFSFDGGGDDTELGITAQGGFSRRNAGGNELFLELKLGLVDTPDIKFTVGWTFGS